MKNLWFAAALMASLPAMAQEVQARVLSSTAVLQQVAVPRQVCTTQPVIQQSQPSGAGAAMGAIAGGAMGNAIGGGSGRDLATVIGIVGGAVLGNRIEGTRDEVRNVQQCTTQTTLESRVLHYDVIYEYDGKRYSIKMPNDPGPFVRLQLNPVGALPAAPSSTGTPLITSPLSVAPVLPAAPVYVGAPVYVAPAPVYVHAAPVYVHPAPVYGSAGAAFTTYSVVRPAVPVVPVGLSLQWSRNYGGHRRHWH